MPLLQGTSGNGDAAWTNAIDTALTTTRGVTAGTALTIAGKAYTAVAPEVLQGAVVGAAEGAFTAYNLPANSLVAGDVLHLYARLTLADAGGASAITCRFRINGLTTPILAESAAVNGANGDVYILDAKITCRTIGAAGTVVSSALTTTGTPGGTTNLEPFVLASTAVDTTAALAITPTAAFSANDTDVTLDEFFVKVL